MSRRHSILFGFISLILASLACNAFAPSSTEPGVALPPPSVEDLTTTPSSEVVDGLAPTATLPGETPIVVDENGQATVRVLVDLNIRQGPGVVYGRVGFLLANETAAILGRDPASGWWKVVCPARVQEVTECWISGGAQYSTATNTASVPVAAVPPTPTPEPTITATPNDSEEVVAGNNNETPSELMVYGSSEGLFAASLQNVQTAVSLDQPIQLATGTNISNVTISPNGQWVAYTTGNGQTQALRVVNIATQANQLLVTSSDLDDDPSDELSVIVSNVEWLNNSQELVFTTYEAHNQGPGLFSRNDLQLVSIINGTLTELLPSGDFAGVFSVSGNRITGSSADAVLMTTTAGGEATTLIEFPRINTASEYIYYPLPQWIGGNTAYVSIPDEDPFASGVFSIWQLSANGTAVEGPTLSGFSLFDSVRWSPNGSQLAFIDQASERGTAVLNFADGDGQNVSPYDTSNTINLFDWSPNSQFILYTTNNYYGIGQEDGAPVEFPYTNNVSDMQWLNDSVFITAVGTRGQWSLFSNTLNGNVSSLITVDADFVEFDLWTP